MKNSISSPKFRLAEIAAAIGASVEGDDQTLIRNIAPIQTAEAGDLSFVAGQKYTRYIATTSASALILAPGVACDRVPVLRHNNPYLAYACAVALLNPEQPLVPAGIHESAVVEQGAVIHPSAAVGPLCHVCRGAHIGAATQLVSSVFVGEDVSVGENCLLYPGVSIMRDCRIGKDVILHSGVVIGSDGFGFAQSDEGAVKIKQIGWVEVADEVEIGANSTVDRGAIGPTRIGYRTKIDNLVQIGHNVQIGEHCLIVSQVGISGSTHLGNRVILAGQVGIAGHLKIGDNVTVAAQSGVNSSIEAGKIVFGYPARDIQQTQRIFAASTRLPELLRRVRKLEQAIGDKSSD